MYRRGPGTPYVSPVFTADEATVALARRGTTPAAVLRSYLEIKRSKGRTKHECSNKLEMLERMFPEDADEFIAIRQEFNLPPSRVFRDSMGDNLRRTQTASSVPYRTVTPMNRTNTTPRQSIPNVVTVRRAPTTTIQTHRPVEESEDGQAPPPYERIDPEPDATRMLEQRLAAEAERAQHTSSSADVFVMPDPPRTSQPNRTSLVSPNAVSANPTSPSTSAARPGMPERIPSDPQLRQIWEESQFDEAKRMSIAAERERLEMEEALRLSLAESEQHQGGQSSSSAGPSSAMNMPVAYSAEDESHRASSFNASSGPSHGQQWPESGSTAAIDGITHGVQALQTGAQEVSLLDDDDTSPLQAPMLTPMKTGAVMQSKNPFLSQTERNEAAPSAPTQSHQPDTVYGYPTLALPQTPQPSTSTPVGNGSNYPSNPLRDSPGSSYTTYNQSLRSGKPLPSPPGPGGIQPGQGSPQYRNFSPPAGPPPSHLRVASSPVQSSFSPPALPPRRDTQATEVSNAGAAYGLEQPSTSAHVSSEPSQSAFNSGGDPLELLRAYDTVFLVDDSASMVGDRWEETKSTIIGVAEIAARYDVDGIDVYFFNSKRVGKELRNREDVEDLFAGLTPRGSTPTGARLDVILRQYIGRLERSAFTNDPADAVKPMNLIVVTDSSPSDDPASVIATYAARLDKGQYPLTQLGIQFFQIGNNVEAREMFQHLDDGLAEIHGVRDMVDTVPYTGDMSADFVVKTLLGGINRRLDHRD